MRVVREDEGRRDETQRDEMKELCDVVKERGREYGIQEWVEGDENGNEGGDYDYIAAVPEEMEPQPCHRSPLAVS